MTRSLLVLLVAIVASLSSLARAQTQEVADTVFLNATIHTMDDARPVAQAIAIKGDRVLRVGTEREIRPLVFPRTRVVDLRGATVLPGLIDAHAHMHGLGAYGLGMLDFSAAHDFHEVVEAVAQRAKGAEQGRWVLGGRWDHESWPGKELPTHHELSEAAPANPVWLRRVDGHAGLANAAAMRRAGITRDTPNPPGGEILRDDTGEPTGVLVDNAMGLVTSVIDDASFTTEALVLKAQEMCLAAGLTGVHDMGITPDEIEVYQRLAREGKLKIRVYGLISGAYAQEWFARRTLITGPRFTMRGTKIYIDGAMGSRGAWMKAPYADRPVDSDGRPYTGLAVMTPDAIEAAARHALGRGYQVCVHAIGDRGNSETLDAFERAAESSGMPLATSRFRVEHCQLLDRSDIPRFGALGVIASMQPTHCTSDMRWVEERVGPERAKGAYAWQSLLDAGATLAFGSDFPVEHQNPFLGLYAAATRQNLDGWPEGGWLPEERVSREQALRAFTLGAAYAEFNERRKGSLVEGKYADFVVIDRDIMSCEAREIADTRVFATVIAGEIVYESEGSPTREGR